MILCTFERKVMLIMAFNKTKYDNAYIAQNYDRLNIMLPKGARDIIKLRAQQNGESVNSYISNLILWDIGECSWLDVFNKNLSE